MKTPEFIKTMSKIDKATYAFYAISNLIEATDVAENEKEYFNLIDRLTCNLPIFLKNLTLTIRSLNISCKNLQDRTTFDLNNSKFFEAILDDLGNKYEHEIEIGTYQKVSGISNQEKMQKLYLDFAKLK